MISQLTPREWQVLRLMRQGKNNRAIATELNIGYATVRSHVRGVIEKLGVHSKLEAVAEANDRGLLTWNGA